MQNINTKSYWDFRFATGDWEKKSGRNQTKHFAVSQIPYLEISKDFSGTILDFGCGLGDAFPIYKASFPLAHLIGIDISIEAVNKCNETYGNLGKFICGSYSEVPIVDIIIASNVFEHLNDDLAIAKYFIRKCKLLYIVVPYKEEIASGNEHINTYNRNHFLDIGKYEYNIFTSKGWSQYGLKLNCLSASHK